jgi:predicted permease
MQVSDKTVWTAVAGVFLALFWFWEPDQFDETFRAMAGVALRMILLAFAAVLAYQAYDGFRSGLTGTPPVTSKPEADPSSASARFGGIAWGLIASFISVSLSAFALGLVGRFP